MPQTNHAWLLALTSLALVASGCEVGPNYHTPHITVPDAWKTAATQPATQPNAALVTTAPADIYNWWKTLNDPVLNDLIAKAVEQNFDLKIAIERVRQARAVRGIAGSQLLPTVNAIGNYQRERVSANNPIGHALGSSDYNDWQGGFDANWEIDVFGRIRRGVEVADAGIATAEDTRRGVLISVLAETARNYVDLRAAQRRLDVANNILGVQRNTLQLVILRRNAGEVGDFDVSRAEADVHTTEATIPAMQEEIDGSIYNLADLLGQSPTTLDKQLVPVAPIPIPSTSIALGIPSDLLRRRPDIRRSERQLAATTSSIGIAVAGYYPRFSLTGEFTMDASKFAHVGDWSSRQFGFGPTVEWNVFDAGRTHNNVQFAEAKQREAFTTYQQTVVDGLKEVETSISRYANETRRRQFLADAVKANEQSVSLAKLQYKAGTIDLLQVLDTQRSLFASQDALAVNDQAIATHSIALYKSLGGGWESIDHPTTQPALASLK